MKAFSLWTLLSLSALPGAVSLSVFPSPARAWDPFRVENSHVARGNEQLQAHDADGALHEYEAAARELPAEPGVHLDRGLALLAKGVLDRAREALLVATEPPAPTQIRADAYYDMGIAFYRQGDAASTQAAQQATQGGAAPLQGAPGQPSDAPHADHHEASRLFREAADSFRRSLRARPSNRDAAWNLELALRRIHDEDEAQRREDERQRAQQEQQQGQQGQQQQQGDQQGQQQQQQQGDSQSGQQGQHQQAQNDQGQQGQQQQGQQGREPSQQPNGAQGQQQQEQQAHSVGGNDSAAQTDATQSQQASADGLPANVARVLDALPDSTVERARARAQAMRENREPQQDW